MYVSSQHGPTSKYWIPSVRIQAVWYDTFIVSAVIISAAFSMTHRLCLGLPGSDIDLSVPEPDDFGYAFGTSIFFFCQMWVATALWRRLHVGYSQWPWRLAALQDPRLSNDEKALICKQFFNAKDCCLDRGVSQPLQRVLEEPSDLTGRMAPVPESISITKIVNAQIENNFARACSASKCARGFLDGTPRFRFVMIWFPLLEFI